MMLIGGFGVANANPIDQPNPVDFLDSASNPNHIYAQGTPVSFRVETFKPAYDADMTCTLVFGIMKRDSNEFWRGKVLSGTVSTPYGYGMSLKPNENGEFVINSSINQDASVSFPKGVLAVEVYNDKGELLHTEDGIPAFIPIVDKSGVPAVIVDVNHAEGYGANEASAFHMTDSDLDHVYFQGDTLAVDFEIAKLVNDSYLAGMMEGQKMKLYFGTYSDEKASFNSNVQVLEGLPKDGGGYYFEGIVNGGVVKASGKIAAGIPVGIVGVKAVLPQMMGGQEIAAPLLSSDSKSAFVGISDIQIPGVTVSPALSQIKNFYNVEVPMAFTKEGYGRVTFMPGLNFLDYKDQLPLLESCISIAYDPAAKEMSYEFMTDKLEFLKDIDASIEIFNLVEKIQQQITENQPVAEQLELYVYEGAGPVPAPDMGDYIKYDYMAYSPSEDILMMPVEHFTKYSIKPKSAGEESQKPDDALYEELKPGYSPVVNSSKEWTVKLSSEALADSLAEGIAVFRVDESNVKKIAIEPIKDASNPKNIILKHSSEFEAGSYTIYIGTELKAVGGKSLSKAVRMSFRVE